MSLEKYEKCFLYHWVLEKNKMMGFLWTAIVTMSAFESIKDAAKTEGKPFLESCISARSNVFATSLTSTALFNAKLRMVVIT